MATTKKEMALVSTSGNLQISGKGKDLYTKLNEFVKDALIENEHYGKIPGTNKPSLFKGGAELLAKEADLVPTFEVLNEKIDFDQPFFAQMVKCTLHKDGEKISEAMGACNSKERKFTNSKIDQYFLYNNVPKMAEKRAYVSAVVRAWGLSGIFTQDMEDLQADPEKEEKRAPEGITLPPASPTEKQKHNPFPGKPDNTHDQPAYFKSLYFAQSKIQYMTAPERHEWNKQYIGKESTSTFTLYDWEKACELARMQSNPIEFTITDEDESDPEGKKVLPHFDHKNGNNAGISEMQLKAISILCEKKGYKMKEDLSGWTVDQAGQAINFLNDN